MDTVNAVLARKLGLVARAATPEEIATPPTPMRQMRRALGRAADAAAGLSASVLSIGEEDIEFDALIDSGPQGWVVLGLRDGANVGLTGLFLIDPSLRSAFVEMQTMGDLLPPSKNHRAVTRTDSVLSMPFAIRLMKELDEVGFGGDAVDPASYDIGVIDGLHTAGLVMTQGMYRCWRISVQVGGGEREGEFMVAMRLADEVVEVAASPSSDWTARLRAAVEEAPAELDAVLTCIKLPIDKIRAFEVGQVLHLPGTTVGSVTLTGPDGTQVATARLGQVAGKRAVRIERPEIELQDSAPAAPVAAPEPAFEGGVNAAPAKMENQQTPGAPAHLVAGPSEA